MKKIKKFYGLSGKKQYSVTSERVTKNSEYNQGRWDNDCKNKPLAPLKYEERDK
jgi:hypothetical protein